VVRQSTSPDIDEFEASSSEFFSFARGCFVFLNQFLEAESLGQLGKTTQ
jgi:hypothetical protein